MRFMIMRSALLATILSIVFLSSCNQSGPVAATADNNKPETPKNEIWIAPDTGTLGSSEKDSLIRYGRELIANTAFYLGPHGSVLKITNGMNCQNCHLQAGTKAYGNNFSAVNLYLS